MTKEEQLANLPSYARVETKFPDWKQRYIKYNSNLHKENKSYVEDVVKRISELPSQSWQKLEWNVGDNKRKITDYILQFRASGIRIKKADFFLHWFVQIHKFQSLVGRKDILQEKKV